MAMVLVTVKLPRNPDHDPRNKVMGLCPVNGFRCTDVTGEHHTVVVVAPSCLTEDEAVAYAEIVVRRARPNGHITRFEVVTPQR